MQDKILRSKQSEGERATPDTTPADDRDTQTLAPANVTSGNSSTGYTVNHLLEDGTSVKTYNNVRPLAGNARLVFDQQSERPALLDDPDDALCGSLIVGQITFFTS